MLQHKSQIEALEGKLSEKSKTTDLAIKERDNAENMMENLSMEIEELNLKIEELMLEGQMQKNTIKKFLEKEE